MSAGFLRTLILRNLIAAAGALLLWLATDYVYVVGAYHHSNVWLTAEWLLVVTAFMSFFAATWSVSTGIVVFRALWSLLSAIGLTMLWFACALPIVYWVHLAVGGAE